MSKVNLKPINDRVVIQNVGMVLMTECAISNLPDKKEVATAGTGAGMYDDMM